MFRIRRERREKRIRMLRHIRLTRQIRPYPHVPDEILLLLFSHIPLSDLILSVGRVCRDWARNQREELTRRHSVFIFQKNKQLKYYRDQQNPFGSELITRVRRDDGETAWHQLQPLKQIRFNAIQMPNAELNEEFTSFLMNIMPNVTHLSVAYRLDHFMHPHSALMTLEQLTRLTNHYANRLESFTLDYVFDYIAYYDPYRYSIHFDSDDYYYSPSEIEDEFLNSAIALFESINRRGPLRHLMLNGSYPELNGTQLDLSRLESFVVHRHFDHTLRAAILNSHHHGNVRVASNAPLLAERGLECSPQLARNWVRYHFLDLFSGDNYENLNEFCGRFTSLTTLEMAIVLPPNTYHQMTMTMLARCLTQLPHLIHLRLNAGIIPKDERTPQPPLAQVSSVRLLSLVMNQCSHSHTQQLHIAQIFPNLQVLDLNYKTDKCEECGYGLNASNTSDRVVGSADASNCPTVGTDANSSKLSGRALYENCARQALLPLRSCANVHTVKLCLSIGNRTTYDLKFLTKRAHQWRIIPVDDHL